LWWVCPVTCPQRPPHRGAQGAPHGEVLSARVATPGRNQAQGRRWHSLPQGSPCVAGTRRRGSTSLDVVSGEVMPRWCTGLRLRGGRVRGSGCVLLADDVEHTSTPAGRPCCDPLSRPRCRWLAPHSPRGVSGRWCGPRSVRVDDAGRSHVTGLRGEGLVLAGVDAMLRPRGCRLAGGRGCPLMPGRPCNVESHRMPSRSRLDAAASGAFTAAPLCSHLRIWRRPKASI
jgi:hypothetical protein